MSTLTDSTAVAAAARRHIFGRGWRKITWVMIAWGALFALLSLIAFGSGGHEIVECQKIGGGFGDVCKQAVVEKIESKVEHLLTIGVLGLLGLTAVWAVTRPKD